MQMPATPDQSRFYTSLLFELGAPFNAAAKLSVLENLSREVLREVSPRMLVVDEVHHLLAGSYREQRASLNLLKFLANDLQMTIVLVVRIPADRDQPFRIIVTADSGIVTGISGLS